MHKHYVLNNQLNVVLMVIMFVALIIEYITSFYGQNEINEGTYSLFIIMVIGIINITLSSMGKFKSSRFILIFFIPFSLYIIPLFGKSLFQQFVWYPYTTAVFGLMVLLLYDIKKEKKYTIVLSLYILFFVLFYDVIVYQISYADYPIFKKMITIYPMIKLSHLAVYSAVYLSALYLIRINNKSQNEILEKSNVIEEQNRILKEHHDEMNAQNEEMKTMMEELRETQTQLINSEKMASLGVLTAGLAHEINNPINFISSGITGLKKVVTSFDDLIKNIDLYGDKPTEAEIRKIIGHIRSTNFKEKYNALLQLTSIIEKGIGRTNELVNGLRIFSRSGNDELVQTDIHEIINISLTLLSNVCKDNNIRIEKHYNNLPFIYTIDTSISQVMMNIFSNAIHAIGQDGTIVVKTTSDMNTIYIRINDDGCGMTEEVKKHIFEPFYTTKEPGKGTGLGMAIAYSIVKKHHGNIKVLSELGKGSEFIVSLPINLQEILSKNE